VRARQGSAALLAAAVGLGCVSVLVKLAYEAGAHPTSLFAARVGVAALLLTAVAALRAEPGRPRPRQLALGAAGGAAFAGAGILEALALSRAAAATVVVLEFIAPVWVAGASWLLWRTAPGRGRAALIGLVVAGTVLLVASPGGGHVAAGPAALALAASLLAAAFFIAMAELAREAGPRRAAGLLCTGAVPLALLAPGAGLTELQTLPRAGFALSIGALTAASLLLLCAGLATTGAVSGVAIAGAEPVAAALLGWLVLGEDLTALQLLGAAAVVAGVLQIARLPSAAPLIEPDGRDEDDPDYDVLPEPFDAPDQESVREHHRN
jgi:drug/metabolite transporter (DMT)-like permease